MGFREVFTGEGWIFVQKDDCMMMLGECPGAIPPAELGDHNYFSYLVVDNANEYFNELKQNNVEFIAEIADKPWMMREFGIRTPDGFRIMIGQRI